MHVFWRHGYHATSIDDLVRSIGVNRASIYATFGDKHALFVAALTHYGATNLITLKHVLHDPERAVTGICNVIDVFAKISSSESGVMGCLLGSATLELLPDDAEVADVVSRCYSARRTEFERALKRAQREGDLAATLDVPATAAYLVTFLQGLRMMGKTRLTHAAALKAARVSYAVLGIKHRRAPATSRI